MKSTELNYAYLSAVNMHQQWTKEHENKDKSSQISVDDKLYVHVLHVQVLHWNNSDTSTTDTRFILTKGSFPLKAPVWL